MKINNIGEFMSSEILFLLTSTQEPYIKDALDLLFLPSGLEYRFRYRRKWLSEQFQDKQIVKKLKNMNALLIHIESKLLNNGAYKITEFIPIRRGKIIDIKYYGEILWVAFSLEDWIKYTNNEVGLNQHHDYIKSLTPNDSKEYVKQILYFVQDFKIECISDSDNEEEIIANWFNIVKEISKLEAHKSMNSIFTKFISIKNLKNGKKILPIRNIYNISEDNSLISSFNFNSNTEYLIEILQYCANGKIDEPIKFKIVLDEKNIINLKQEDLIQGRYDILKFVIKTSAIEDDTYSYIQFVKDEENSKKYIISEPFIIVKILGNKLRILLSSLSIFIGLLLTGISSQIIEKGVISQGTLVISVIGGIITTIGTYYLRKK